MRNSEIAKNILNFLNGIDIMVGERGFYGTQIYYVKREDNGDKREFISEIFDMTEWLRFYVR